MRSRLIIREEGSTLLSGAILFSILGILAITIITSSDAHKIVSDDTVVRSQALSVNIATGIDGIYSNEDGSFSASIPAGALRRLRTQLEENGYPDPNNVCFQSYIITGTGPGCAVPIAELFQYDLSYAPCGEGADRLECRTAVEKAFRGGCRQDWKICAINLGTGNVAVIPINERTF